MGILARLLGSRYGRRRGVLAHEAIEQAAPQLPPLTPTPAIAQKLKRPEPTPTTRQLSDPGVTAATRTHRMPGGTPSTQRIHNPGRPGR